MKNEPEGAEYRYTTTVEQCDVEDRAALMSAPVKNGAIVAGSSRSHWSTRESPRSTETQ